MGYRISDRKITVSEGGGCYILAGLPFFAGGIAAFYMLYQSKAMSLESAGASLVAFALGALLLFYRKKIILDKDSKSVIYTRNFLFPVSSRYYNASDVKEALVFSELRSHTNNENHHDYTVYSLKLTGANLFVFESETAEETRKLARKAAEFLQCAYCDKTVNPPVYIEPGGVEKPLSERKQDIAPVIRPSGALCSYSDSGSRVEIIIPYVHGIAQILISLFFFFAGICVAAGIIIIGFPIIFKPETDISTRIIFVCAATIPADIVVLHALIRMFSRTVISLENGVISICKNGFSRFSVKIPLRQITQVFCDDKNRVMNVISSSSSVEIGKNLPLTELKWLTGVISQYIHADSR